MPGELRIKLRKLTKKLKRKEMIRNIKSNTYMKILDYAEPRPAAMTSIQRRHTSLTENLVPVLMSSTVSKGILSASAMSGSNVVCVTTETVVGIATLLNLPDQPKPSVF